VNQTVNVDYHYVHSTITFNLYDSAGDEHSASSNLKGSFPNTNFQKQEEVILPLQNLFLLIYKRT
jgi:hypothetical protein